MSQFHETVYGHRFFDHQLPELTKALTAVAEAFKISESLRALVEAQVIASTPKRRNNVDPRVVDKLQDLILKIKDDFPDLTNGENNSVQSEYIDRLNDIILIIMGKL